MSYGRLKLPGYQIYPHQLYTLRKKIAEAAKPESVPLPELMPESFMRGYTKFDTSQAMCDAGGIESPDDLQSDE